MEREVAPAAQHSGERPLSELARELTELGVPDALMLRRVLHVRALLREADRELATIEAYFSPPASEPPQSPPS